MRVRDIMKRHPRVARLEENLAAAARLMAEVDCGVLPVLDDTEVVVGVITDRDICLALAANNPMPTEATVEQVMSSDVCNCGPDDSVDSALEKMRKRRVRRLPVVDAAGELLGLLSLDEVALEARELADEEFGRPSYAQIAETLMAINQPQLLSTAHG